MKNTIFASLFMLISMFVLAQEKTIERSFDNVKNVKVTVGSGNVTLKKSADQKVNVNVKYNDNFNPKFEQNGDRLILGEETSKGNFSGSSRWTIELPDNLKVKVTTGSGDVSVESLKIELSSNAGSGDVTLRNAQGELDFNTGSGNIELENIDGELKFNTGSGDIRATNSKGLFSFNSGSGDVKISKFNGEVRANTGSGNIQAKEMILTGPGAFNSGSGDATVSLSAPLIADISINSGSGNSTLSFNGHEISGQVEMAANEKNGKIKAPFKFDSEEIVRERGSDARIVKKAKLGDKDIKIKVATGSGTAEIAK